MNAFLLVLAIGLAVLDFTCFWAMKVRDAMPSARRIDTGAVAAPDLPFACTAAPALPAQPPQPPRKP